MTGLPAVHPSPGKLPRSLTPFIGRQTDLEMLLKLIGDPSVRLVTILGTGGVGKTRFALELAWMLQAQFQQGAVFVPLAPLSSVDELLPTLAGSLMVQLPPGGDLQQAVMDQLGNMQVLLVLDNFEHLLDEAALICDILQAGPQVKVLITSREKLNLENEVLYHLQGLEFPPAGDLQNVGEFDAISLFVQKAKQVRPFFSLNGEDAPAIARICQLVDGNSLGILLAAAWVEHFFPAEISDQISSSLGFLTTNLRNVPARHSCMRAVFDSSYNRLSDQQKTIFRKLAVFRGGFNLAAAEAITGADLQHLLALVDKSLLWRDAATGRYDLHELLRQYANEELTAANEHENLLAAHAGFYSAFVCQRQMLLKSSHQAAALDAIQSDFENIRQAWGWTIEKRNFAAARSMIPGLYAFCDMRSQFYEGEALFRLACQGLMPQAGEAPHPALALALLSWYDLRSYIERFESYEEITSQAQSCLEQAISLRDAEGIAASQVLLGAIAEDQGNFEKAIRSYEAGMLSYPPFDDIYWVNMRIGLCHQAAREYPEAIQSFQVSFKRGVEIGERVKMGWSLLNIGDTLLLQGKPAEAESYLAQSRTLFLEIGTVVGTLWSNYSLSRVALNTGNPGRSRELAEMAQQIAMQIHSISWLRKIDNLLKQIDPQLSQAFTRLKGQDLEPLSQRELEVLQLLKSDLNGPEMARKLVVSLNTIRYHTKNIYQKLQVNNRLEAIHRAKELDL